MFAVTSDMIMNSLSSFCSISWIHYVLMINISYNLCCYCFRVWDLYIYIYISNLSLEIFLYEKKEELASHVLTRSLRNGLRTFRYQTMHFPFWLL